MSGDVAEAKLEPSPRDILAEGVNRLQGLILDYEKAQTRLAADFGRRAEDLVSAVKKALDAAEAEDGE